MLKDPAFWRGAKKGWLVGTVAILALVAWLVGTLTITVTWR